MVQIKTMKNPLVTDKDKDAFCFRSKCSQTLTEKQLAKEMAAYNSSFTEADNIGILNVLNTVVIKHLSKGYSVELPFGSIRPNATGTCSSIQDSFSVRECFFPLLRSCADRILLCNLSYSSQFFGRCLHMLHNTPTCGILPFPCRKLR